MQSLLFEIGNPPPHKKKKSFGSKNKIGGAQLYYIYN